MTRHSISYVCTGIMYKIYVFRWRSLSISYLFAGTMKVIYVHRWSGVSISYVWTGRMKEFYVCRWRGASITWKLFMHTDVGEWPLATCALVDWQKKIIHLDDPACPLATCSLAEWMKSTSKYEEAIPLADKKIKKLLIVITRRVQYLRVLRQIEIILRVKMMKRFH